MPSNGKYRIRVTNAEGQEFIFTLSEGKSILKKIGGLGHGIYLYDGESIKENDTCDSLDMKKGKIYYIDWIKTNL